MKLLLIDIETAPHMAAVWGLWKENIPLDRLIKPGYTLCWAAKWYGEKEVMFDSILSGHKKMVKGIHKLLDEADAVIHYNGSKFDIPTLNKEFLLQGLKPPAPIKQIDLLKTARTKFRLASNKLDFVANALGYGKKVRHKGLELWFECMAKNPQAWEQMKEYNIHDVVLLERVYDRLKPWIKSHPSVLSGVEGTACPKCGSHKATKRGSAVTAAGRYQRYQCNECGSWFRSSVNERPKGERYVEVQ
jgi:DNA-directed RNA polymerase subunit RPC12/RpoP